MGGRNASSPALPDDPGLSTGDRGRAPSAAGARPPKPEATWELVLKRNPVERLKREKAPLGIRDELPALIAQGYDAVAEEDMVRLQWWGLYHDKPKIGTFMLRVKLPSGHLTPAKLRAIGEVSNLYGKGDGELATRQNIQLHWLELTKLPDVFAHLDRAGITTAGGCGDTVRNITGCPVQGLATDELFDCTPVVQAAADHFYGNPDFANLPRKHKYTIAACNDRCNAPEINCVSLVGAVHEGREGFAVLVGGGLSSVPRLARELGVFVPKEEANEILAAVTGAWADDLRYRVSRVKARLKFMVDDIGAEGMRERVETRIGRKLEDFTLPPIDVQPSHHLGVHEQKDPGLRYIGVPVHLGLISGDQMIAVADLAERVGGDVRITRQQNFIVANVPVAEVDATVAELARIGFSLDINPVRGNSIACTGRAALQLLRHRDEDAPRPADRAPRRALRAADRRPAAAPRRLPARVRAALDRRSRLPGHDRARRGRREAPGLRHLRPRRPRAGRGDRQAALPARADRRARRRGRRTDRRLDHRPAATASRSRSSHGVWTTTRSEGSQVSSQRAHG